MPKDVKLVPMLFQCLGDGIMIKGLQEQGLIDEWLDYWLQDEFLEHYAYIDVCNEPRTISSPWQKAFIIEMLQTVKQRVRHKNIPVTVGIAYDTFSADIQFIEEVVKYSDYVDFHYYENNPDEYITRLRWVIDYSRQFDKPIVISEFNIETSEEQQAYWLADVLHIIKEENIKGYIVHNLREPQPQHSWGIYRKNWTPKPCLELFP